MVTGTVDSDQRIYSKLKDVLIQRRSTALRFKQSNDTLHEISDIWRQEKWIPHLKVFPFCSVIIHHGGTGTIGSAVKSAVPSIVIPILDVDQISNGQSLQDNGLGLMLQTKLDLDKDTCVLRKTVFEIIDNPKYKQNAIKIEKHLKDGLFQITEIIHRCFSKYCDDPDSEDDFNCNDPLL